MPDRSEEERRRLYRLAGTGLEFFSTLMGGLILGYLLDRWLGTAPWIMLVGIFFGFGVAFLRLVQMSKGR